MQIARFVPSEVNEKMRCAASAVRRGLNHCSTKLVAAAIPYANVLHCNRAFITIRKIARIHSLDAANYARRAGLW